MRAGCILPRPMENSDESDYEPEDIFEEIDPTEPPSLDARIRAGDEVAADEICYEDDATVEWDEAWMAERRYNDLLDEKRPKDAPPPPPNPESPTP
jgi:hypothetical protein